MSDFIFEYTNGSGSGSGSGGEPEPILVPCDPSCPLPPDAPLQEYYRTPTTPGGNPILYPITQTDICCPIVRRADVFEERPCNQCPPLPSGWHYGSTTYRLYGDGSITGDYCCPVIEPEPEPSGEQPCENCLVKVEGEQYSEENPCLECISGECIEYAPSPCIPLSWEDYRTLYDANVGPDSHTIDTSVKVCTPYAFNLAVTVGCPLRIKDFVDADQTTTQNIPEDTVSIYNEEIEYGTIVKEGDGTLVINGPTYAKLIQCNGGTIVINDHNAFDPNVCVMIAKDGIIVCNYGTNRMNVGSLFFEVEEETAYTSTNKILSFGGKIDLGFGGISLNNIKGIPHYLELLKTGRNGGTWDGSSGITTSASKNGIKNIGYSIDNNTLTIAWALTGDTTLDGKVDMFDIIRILASGKYNTGSIDAIWTDGDSNYDGRVDIMDIVSILSAGGYNQGNYLPKDENFTISWNPPKEHFGTNAKTVSVQTKDNKYYTLDRKYEPSFKQGSMEKNIVCTPMTQLDCSKLGGSVFNDDDVPCNDSSCDRLEIANPRIGVCCLDYCLMIKDTDSATAEKTCATLQGVWLGYNTVCSDLSCGNDQRIIKT